MAQQCGKFFAARTSHGRISGEKIQDAVRSDRILEPRALVERSPHDSNAGSATGTEATFATTRRALDEGADPVAVIQVDSHRTTTTDPILIGLREQVAREGRRQSGPHWASDLRTRAHH
jgi:hypothetical protein